MTTLLPECETDWLAAASLDDWHANILCVGEIAPQQNLNLAIVAFDEYRREYDPFARLILAGPQTDAAYAREVRDFVHSLQIAGHVLMLDPTEAQLKALYRTADAVLQTGLECDEEASRIAARYLVPVISSKDANTPRKLAEAIRDVLFV